MSKSPFIFGVLNNARIPPAEVMLIIEIAASENCFFHQMENRYWFVTKYEHQGDPFDRDLAQRVFDKLSDSGFTYWSKR